MLIGAGFFTKEIIFHERVFSYFGKSIFKLELNLICYEPTTYIFDPPGDLYNLWSM